MAKPPSTTLLSLLATLVSSANSSPAPPSFLCPHINYKRNIPPPPPTRQIPNKYVQGDDGFWRRVESYTLYGSTVPCTGPSTQIASSGNNQLQVSSDYATPDDDIRDSLPLGWSLNPAPNENRSTLILALSLVLAFFICFFIISCVFWRKSVIKRRRRDLEAEYKERQLVHPAEDEPRDFVEKESKPKQKILARATARWKANVRHAARQRKGKRVAPSKSSQPSHSPNNSHIRLSVSSPPSPISSRRSSVVSDDLSRSIIGELKSSVSLSHETTSTVASPHTNVPVSPPAYHHGGQAPPVTYSYAIPPALSRQPSQSSFRARIDPHGSGITTPMHFHAAHVATDDKSLLARLADLASRPPEDAPTDTLHDCDIRVPAWHDEFEEVPHNLVASNDHPPDITCMPSSLFPSPPSKERMAAADPYEYSFSLEDLAALEPELEPSAPPFQLDSALPLNDTQTVPSAPPFTDDAELFVDVHPSTESVLCPPDVVGEMGQNHDRMTLAEIPLSVLPNVQPSRDDIMLPGYRP